MSLENIMLHRKTLLSLSLNDCLVALVIGLVSLAMPGKASAQLAPQNYAGPTFGPLLENDGYYARFSGEPFKSMSWDGARRFAESLRITRNGRMYTGFLYTPNTPSENAFVVANLRPNEDWIGLFQAPRARTPSTNWRLLNNRTLSFNGWGANEPDDQKNGAWTRCRLISFFNGIQYTSNGESSSFAPMTNQSNETGCENCGMLRADGRFKDKECNSHGNGFIVEFRRL